MLPYIIEMNLCFLKLICFSLFNFTMYPFYSSNLLVNTQSVCGPQKLLQLPTVSGSIEVWDFLSVDSQV